MLAKIATEFSKRSPPLKDAVARKFQKKIDWKKLILQGQRMYKWIFGAQLQTLRKSQSKPPMPIQHLGLSK